MPKAKKTKKSSAATKRKEKQPRAEQPLPKPQESMSGSEDNGQSDLDMGDDPEDLSDDEPPTTQMRRHRRPKLDSWAKEIIDDLVRQHGEEIQTQFFQSRSPDVDLLEKYIKEANSRIRTANLKHKVNKDRNVIPEGLYRNHFQTWMNLVESDAVKNDPDKGWEAYQQTYKIIRLNNREYHLPDEWNFPPDATRDMFGEPPEGMGEISDADSAVDYSDESESEDSDLDDVEGIDGIDALESRMREEYSSLSRGKVLYWWPIGTGTQVFVRYGPKKKPIYRVRAGSSEVFDKRSTELVLSETRGTKKMIISDDGFRKEVWEFHRDQVLDIIGVGWKVDDDDEHGVNALALIRPRKDVYPHTRALVKWKDGMVTLERRGFVRRIAMGNSANGDRMLYLKARELENAYWGYDVEDESDTEASDSESGQEQRPSKHKTRSSQSRRRPQKKKGHKYATETDTESDADSVASLEIVRSKRRGGASKRYKKEADIDDSIRRLTRELDELKLKKNKSHDKKKASLRPRRRR